MLDALELSKPILPRRSCKIHEPDRIDSRFVRRASLPCPQCWAENPLNKTPRTFIKLLKRPIAEPGKGGRGLTVTIETQAKLVYEACSYSKPALVWRLREWTK